MKRRLTIMPPWAVDDGGARDMLESVACLTIEVKTGAIPDK